MGAGKYRHLMTLEQPIAGDASEASGEVLSTWTKLASMWCSLVPLSGKELFAAQQVRAQTTHLVRTRHRNDLTITTAMRLTYRSRIFAIESAVNVGEMNNETLMQVVES